MFLVEIRGGMSLYTAFLHNIYNPFWHNIKGSGYKVGVKFDKESLVLEQSNYTTKIVNQCKSLSFGFVIGQIILLEILY